MVSAIHWLVIPLTFVTTGQTASTYVRFVIKKVLNPSLFVNTPPAGIGGPKAGTSFERLTAMLHRVESDGKECHSQETQYIFIGPTIHCHIA